MIRLVIFFILPTINNNNNKESILLKCIVWHWIKCSYLKKPCEDKSSYPYYLDGWIIIGLAIKPKFCSLLILTSTLLLIIL